MEALYKYVGSLLWIFLPCFGSYLSGLPTEVFAVAGVSVALWPGLDACLLAVNTPAGNLFSVFSSGC